MKKLLVKGLICVALIGCCAKAQAQFAYAKQWNINVGAGWVPVKGYAFRLGAETIFGLSSSSIQMKLGYTAIPSKIETKDFTFDRYTFAVNYAFSFDKIIQTKSFFLNLVGGVVAGYEDMPSKVGAYTIHNKDRWLGGVNVSVVGEVPIAKKINVYLEPQMTYMVNSNIQPVEFTLMGGFKFYL